MMLGWSRKRWSGALAGETKVSVAGCRMHGVMIWIEVVVDRGGQVRGDEVRERERERERGREGERKRERAFKSFAFLSSPSQNLCPPPPRRRYRQK